MKKMMQKLVAVAMMSVILVVPLMNGVEAASKHGGPGGQPPRQEQRIERHDGGSYKEMSKGYKQDCQPMMGNPGGHQPKHQEPRQNGKGHGGGGHHHGNVAGTIIGGLLMSMLLGMAGGK